MGEAPPSTQYLGSVQNCCGFTKGSGFTVKRQKGARQGHSEGRGPVPAGILVSENATGAVEKSTPRAGCMHSPRDFHIHYRAQSLGKASAGLSCAGLHGILSSGGILQEGKTGHKAKQGSAPLPGTQLLLQLKKKKKIKKSPKISSSPAQSCSKESSAQVLAISGFVSKTSPDLHPRVTGKSQICLK